ncbi:MAG: O-linked N-acetylglucosamine transferase, SPINDLY family protein, partial [Cyanobacteria bacterium J06627_8]
DRSWLIRQHIREIAPHQVNNLLLLVLLAVMLDRFDSSDLEDWSIIEQLSQTVEPVSSAIATTTVDQLLNTVTIDDRVVQFIASAIPYINDEDGRLVHALMQSANRAAFAQRNSQAAIDLAELCLSQEPDEHNRYFILMQLSAFFQETNQYAEAISTAQKSYDAAQTIVEKIAANHQCTSSQMLTGGSWNDGYRYFQRSQTLLHQFLQEPPSDLEHSSVLRLMTATFFQPYFRDDPQQNHRLQNRVMSFCQDRLQELHGDRVLCYQTRSLTPSLSQMPLKIGYISHCLKRHSVGWIARWVFEHHDRDAVQVYAYFVGAEPEGTDAMQEWFAAYADVAHRMPADPIAIADQIDDDQIDILIDLDSLTLDATCAVMALKPAPIQVSWLGWDAPGLPAVDYYIVDPYVVPEEAKDDYAETLWRLPQTYVAVDGFEVNSPTLRRDAMDIPDDAVVYLSTQRGHKLHPDSVRLQLNIVAAVPKSYLLVKLSGQEEAQRQFWLDMADQEGVKEEQLRFLPNVPSELTHRANLQLADIVLDTYPYNGATTTLETLWMQLPLVTRVGQQFSSRNSYTMMMNVGLEEGIAWTDQDYVDWGIRLGRDANLRKHVAWKLSQSRQSAPLWNGKRFTRQLEDAYRQMWSRYVEQQSDGLP